MTTNPESHISPYISDKPLDSYPKDLLKEIKLMSFSNEKKASIIGSLSFRVQKYPGDIDLKEEFNDCCTHIEVAEKFSKILKKKVNIIAKTRNHYFSEFKAGLDLYYNIFIGILVEGRYFMNKHLGDIAIALYNKKRLDDAELVTILQIAQKNENFKLNSDDYEVIEDIFRNHLIIRWDIKEINRGYKDLPGKKKIELKIALLDTSIVKLDVVAPINERFVEMSNVLLLGLYENPDDQVVSPLNYDYDYLESFEKYIKSSIEELYYSNMKYSPFKMVKRMYSLMKHQNNEKGLEKILPIISSNTALLYQIKGDLDTLKLLFKKFDNPSPIIVKRELDQIKFRLTAVTELSNDFLEKINSMIDLLNEMRDSDSKIRQTYLIAHELKKQINYETITYLNEIGFNPPPASLLPEEQKYDRNIVRTPYESPVDPYVIVDMYQLHEKFDFDDSKITITSKQKKKSKKIYDKYHAEMLKIFDHVGEIIKINPAFITINQVLLYSPNSLDRFLDLRKGKKPSSKYISDILAIRKNISPDIRDTLMARVKKGSGSIASRLYQKAANAYRSRFCSGKARMLEDGEFHYGCHNFTGQLGPSIGVNADASP